MKRTKYQSDEERSILTGVVVHSRVLARIAAKAESDPFRSKWSNLIYKWCLVHHRKYGKAPKAAVQSYFRHYAEKSNDEATVSIVEKFLEGLSEEYARVKKEINEDFLVDMAARYFNRVKIEKAKERVEDSLNRGDVEEALQRMSGFTPINLASDSMRALFDEKEPWANALMQQEENILVQYPGALGEFFGNNLQSDTLIAFLAPEKRGKSFLLMDMAWRAATKNKRKTLLYSVGDMSERQMMRRLAARATGRPLGAGEYVVPYKVIPNEGGTARVKKEVRQEERPLSLKQIGRIVRELKLKTAQSTSTLRMRCTPNSTTRIADIEADIEDLIRQDWIPEVLVIDYADILAPERVMGEGDFRHQTDETWKAMRRLSQKYHMLVVTATQSNAASYDKTTLRRTHFSEDKRKLAHVTGMVGINQTEEEKLRGIFRLNWILLREGFYSESRCVTVAGCLAIANPAVVSAM